MEQGDAVVTGVMDASDPLTEPQKLRQTLQWPPREQQPASEYNMPGLRTMSYPTLLPNGMRTSLEHGQTELMATFF